MKKPVLDITEATAIKTAWPFSRVRITIDVGTLIAMVKGAQNTHKTGRVKRGPVVATIDKAITAMLSSTNRRELLAQFRREDQEARAQLRIAQDHFECDRFMNAAACFELAASHLRRAAIAQIQAMQPFADTTETNPTA